MRLSRKQHVALLGAATAMADCLRDIADRQAALLADVKGLNRGAMPLTTAAIHPDLVRRGQRQGLACSNRFSSQRLLPGRRASISC